MKILVLWLFVPMLAAACGTAKQKETTVAECALSLPAHSDHVAIEDAIDAVANGTLDPCQGSLAHREAYRAELDHVEDPPDASVVLIYRMEFLHPEWGKPSAPRGGSCARGGLSGAPCAGS